MPFPVSAADPDCFEKEPKAPSPPPPRESGARSPSPPSWAHRPTYCGKITPCGVCVCLSSELDSTNALNLRSTCISQPCLQHRALCPGPGSEARNRPRPEVRGQTEDERSEDHSVCPRRCLRLGSQRWSLGSGGCEERGFEPFPGVYRRPILPC